MTAPDKMTELDVAGAVLDVLDVCHKNRAQSAVTRMWQMLEAAGADTDANRRAFEWVCSRHNLQLPRTLVDALAPEDGDADE